MTGPDDLNNLQKSTAADFYASTPDPRINRRTIAAMLRGTPIMGPVSRSRTASDGCAGCDNDTRDGCALTLSKTTPRDRWARATGFRSGDRSGVCSERASPTK